MCPSDTAIGVTLATASRYTCKLGFETSLLRLNCLRVEPCFNHTGVEAKKFLHDFSATGRSETLLDLGLARSCLDRPSLLM